MKVGSRRHANTHLPWGSDPISAVPAAGETIWASIGFFNETEIPSQSPGSITRAGFTDDTEGLYTSSPDVFSLQEYAPPAGAPHVFGLAINTAGIYKWGFGVQVYDQSGGRIVTPQVELVTADNGGGDMTNEFARIGSNFEYGYERTVGGDAAGGWTLSWWSIGEIGGSTSIPIYIGFHQETGETLLAYTNIFVMSLSDMAV